MDHPDCDTAALKRTYAQFRAINSIVAGWRSTYRHYLRPNLRTDRPTTMLDIGSGGGDVARALSNWATRDGYQLTVTAIDPDERAHNWAKAQPSVSGLTFKRCTSRELVTEGHRYDLVISNHLLHHLDPDQFSALLLDSEQLALVRVVHNDIERNLWAYLLFSLGTWPFFPGSFIREDGLTSIRRSYTSKELLAVLPPDWRLDRQRPWRNLLLHDPPGSRQ